MLSEEFRAETQRMTQRGQAKHSCKPLKGRPPPLSDPAVRKQVEEDLREVKVTNQMEAWLAEARQHADIVRLATFR